jgi:O-methyltransferase involved in polyketide biosynthesis
MKTAKYKMKDKQITKLSGVAETLLIPLWARAEEWDKFEPIIMDEHAVNLIKKIDYDFSKFKGSWMSQVGCAVRARILDIQTKRFIQKNPDAVIINIGTGLDTRFFRVDNGQIQWYELDLPESTKVRKMFFSETDRYKMISKSVFDYSWIKDIKERNRSILIISEGTFMYFEENEVKEIFENLIKNFSGAEMLLEILPKILVKFSDKHETVKMMKDKPKFKWGVGKTKEVEKLNSGIKLIEYTNLFDYHKKRWKWFGKIIRFLHLKDRFNNRILRLKLK